MRPTLFLINIILIGSSLTSINAQSIPFWGNLEKGTFETGYQTLWKYDYSRTWKNDRDYQDIQIKEESARPVKISVWYPAKVSGSSKRVQFKDYVSPLNVPDEFKNIAHNLENYDSGNSEKGIQGIFKGNNSAVNQLLDSETAAWHKADIAEGSFPVIIYSLGQNNYNQENTVLWEYLASHGFIVAVVPQLGVSPRSDILLIHKENSYEAQIRDLEFTLQQMHTFPGADTDRILAMGHSMGGVYAMLLAMKNSKIDGYIGLDSSILFDQASYAFKYWETYYYDKDIDIPMLFLSRNSESLNTERIDSYIFSDRHLINFENITHGDFTSYPMLTASTDTALLNSGESQNRSQHYARESHEEMILLTQKFLNHLFNEASFDPSGEMDADYELRERLNIPTEEEFYTLIKSVGFDKAVSVLSKKKKAYPGQEIIRETKMNSLAYEMTYLGKMQDALLLFRLNTEAHPDSPVSAYSLAEGYRMTGNNEMATLAYKKVLKLDPNHENAKKRLEELDNL